MSAEVLKVVRAAGVSMRVEDGRIIAGPREALTADLRELIRAHKDSLIDALKRPVLVVSDVSDSAAGGRERDKKAQDERREKVIAMLRASLHGRLAFIVDDDTTDPVVLTVASRCGDGIKVEVVEIPKAKYDGFAMLELAEKHGKGPELGVIDGDLTKEPEAA